MNPFRYIPIALSTLLISSAVFAKNDRQSLDGIVATVNDSAVTQSEVNTATSAVKAQLSGSNMPIPPASVLQKKVVTQVIDRKLQLQAAAQAGIKIPESQVDDTINNIAKENGVTAEVLYEKVATQHLSRSEYRKEIHDELMIQQIQQQQVASKVVMSPEDVKNFMSSKQWQKMAEPEASAITEYHIEDLIVLLPDAATTSDVANAKKQATALLTQAKQGVSYSRLAQPSNKSLNNMDLGWRKIDDVPSVFAEAILTAKKGSVIGPIQTGNGFHIVRLVDSREQKAPATAAAAMPAPTEKQAQEMVYQRKFSVVLKKWLAKLHSQAVINLHPDTV